VAMDATGDAVALWVQVNIMAAHLVNGTWSASSPVTQYESDWSYGPEVAYVSPGHAVGVWEQQNGITSYVESNSFDSSEGWGEPAIVSEGQDGVLYPRLAVDSHSNATVAWLQMTEPEPSLMLARYFSQAGWSTPKLLASIASDEFSGLYEAVAAVGTNESGRTFAVWGFDAM
jgi:hypothetical protein